MTTNFPSGLDSFTNPTATDAMDSATVPHADQHADVNDAVEALQAKVGVDGSAVTSSLDYKVANQGLTLLGDYTVPDYQGTYTISSIWTSTHQHYRVIVSGGSTSAGAGLLFSVSGAGSTHYSTVAYYTIGAGTLATATRSADTLADIGGLLGSVIDFCGVGDSANYTYASCLSADGTYYRSVAAVVKTTGIPTSITFQTNAGTFYQTKIRVYGYNNG